MAKTFSMGQTIESKPKKHDKAEDNTVSILQLLVTKQKNVIEDKVNDSSRYE